MSDSMAGRGQKRSVWKTMGAVVEHAPRVGRLARKELKETLRDRRTIITLVVMPLLVYPLLSIAFQRFVLTTIPVPTETTFRLGFANNEDAELFVAYLSVGHEIAQDTDDPRSAQRMPAQPRLMLPQFKMFISKDLADAVATRDIDLGVRIRKRAKLNLATPSSAAIDVELLYDPETALSREATDLVERRISLLNGKFLQLRLEQLGVRGRMQPIEAERVRVDVEPSPISFPLATLVPFVLILTTITGAVYPAIDLTAGERERGTLEMLIAAPVPRMGLLIAKYVAVLTVAMLTAAVNCGAMAVTVFSVGLGKQLFGERGLTAELAIEFCGLLLLFAAFFSAVLLALSSFARSFKEAQAYLVPLMLASTAPGIFTMINGVRLTPLLAVTPLANIVLLARDMFEYNAAPLLAFLVLGSTLIYALIAILIAARLFGSDAVLYGSPGSWSDTLHPSHELRDAPTIGTAMLTLAVLSPVLLLASNFIARQTSMGMGARLGLTVVVTVALFVVVPLVVARWSGVRLVKGLGLRRPHLLAFLPALLLGLSLWPFAHEIVVRQQEVGWVTMEPSKLDRVRQLLSEWQQLPVAWTLLCVAIGPALAEEIFFRGFLLSALRTRQSAFLAIVTSATIFGVFHVIVTDSMLFERFLPTTFLGLVLGWLAVRTGSIWPGAVLHATHNGLLVLVAHYRDQLAGHGWGVQEEAHLPRLWLIGALVVAGLGIAIALFVKPASSTDATTVVPQTN